MQQWSPNSWSRYPNAQAFEYPDTIQLSKVVSKLSQLPSLVVKKEIHNLKQKIATASEGKAFILQGGDCAESFNDCKPEIIKNKLKILLEMSHILTKELDKPITIIGRIAGQYTKPRSSLYETKNNSTLPSYRGDLVNRPEFNPEARTPNPELLLKGYNHAAITLNFIRAILKKNNNFFISHEALHLHYETALTKQLENDQWYNLSTHLPWLGMRTGHLESAHTEYLRGIQNPIGIKIGPHANSDWLKAILLKLNPQKELGKILLITRLGNDISRLLPMYIKTVREIQSPVTWSCDPMHGNTETTKEGFKTRHFDKILQELEQAVNIHHSLDSHLGGVHLELTWDNVTECIGGTSGIREVDLKYAYYSLVDPRLNYQQSLEIASKLSQRISLKKCGIL